MICLEPSAPAYQIYLPNQGSLGVRHLAASASRSTLCPQRLCLQGASHPQLPEIQQSGESLGETHGHRPADVLSARGAAHRADLGRGMELPCRLREFSRRGGARDGGALRLVRWLVRAAGGDARPQGPRCAHDHEKSRAQEEGCGFRPNAERSSFRSATRK